MVRRKEAIGFSEVIEAERASGGEGTSVEQIGRKTDR